MLGSKENVVCSKSM